MTNLQILLLIAAFLTLTVGSFIYYIATWDAEAKPALSFIWPDKLPPEASDFSQKNHTLRKDIA